jgi:uncharacterized protein YkwD
MIHARLRPLAVICLLAALALPAAAGAHRRNGCAYARTAAGAASRAAVRHAVLCLINQQRRRHGLSRLRENPRLDRSAQGWSRTMARHREFTHGIDFAARISAVGLRWGTAGENIATGFASADQVVAAWMASTGHCRNILSPDFSLVGTGVVDRSLAGPGSHGATWTQDFALPLGARMPSHNWRAADGCPYRI